MTLLWDADPSATDRYDFAVGQVTRVDTQAAMVRALEDAPQEQLVLIGPEVDMESACQFTEFARVERPEVGVLLLRRRLDVNVLGQALRSGVREVVTADDLTGLADAARRSRELTSRVSGHTVDSSAGTRSARVVTVFSAKGGVGKTTFATNLSTYLASTGSKVLLIDLDLAFGDVGISLQMLPQNSIIDLVSMAGHIDEQAIKSVVTRHESGLDTVSAPSEPSDADRIPGSIVAELIRVAKRHYDYVLLDTPPAFTSHVLAAFDDSDVLVLIATLDIPAVKNLRLTLDTLDLLGNDKDTRLIVLNRSDAKVGLRAEDVVAALKQDIAVMVPNSAAVPASVNRGVPIILDEPKHPVSVALRDLAERFLRAPEPASSTDASGKSTDGQGGRSGRWSFSRGGK
ncbi:MULTISPECIES: AAA family ATPase [unclassified Phycicoccus]|uniref:AAA family ATPase n=1 Tax=unclassified Phycicoccus TaxID=2637926 RepID=UPI000702C0DB|nr:MULTISPECIES: AAA family ATPase [unclassified Phycicoccus]KQU69457.1 chromosome partitioning protein [Phycicoccus sp. Root101]KQZ90679.1 chromosome partitioning protein [Phycicoccus sp. Root563]